MCIYFCIFVYVYKRTNIEIDVDLLQEVMKTYHLKTMKEAINFSLQKTAEAQKRKNLLQMKGKVKWEGDLDEIRKTQ